MAKKNFKQRHLQNTNPLFDGEIRYIPAHAKLASNTEKEQVNKTLIVEWTNPNRESSNLKQFAYSLPKEILALKFNSGKVYTYLKVGEYIWQQLQAIDASQESLGSWVNKNITTKPNLYPAKAEN